MVGELLFCKSFCLSVDMIVDTEGPRFILGEYFPHFESCLSLMKSTGALVRGGGLVGYFSGRKSVRSTLSIYCDGSSLKAWKSFVKDEGYQPLVGEVDKWVSFVFSLEYVSG